MGSSYASSRDRTKRNGFGWAGFGYKEGEREGERVRSVQSGSGEEDDGRVCSAGARREKKRAEEEEAAWLRWPTDGDGVKQTNP